MSDNWDDSDDDWDNSDSEDDELAKRLASANVGASASSSKPKFDDEEDLAVTEKAAQEKNAHQSLRKKGKALADKQKAEQDRKEEEEIARKAMELEQEMEDKMSPEERRLLQRKREEEADNALTDDLFGGMDKFDGNMNKSKAQGAGEEVKMKDLKDHLKHARKVSQCLTGHGNVHFASSFFKECLNLSKSVLDDAAVSELIKSLNVIKNEKVAQAKRKVKGQAQKSKKKDKAAEAKAKKLEVELFGDNNHYDQYDEYADQYEDDFF